MQERAKADIYKSQRDKASSRQRTASRVVLKFMTATKSKKYDKGLLQDARAFAASKWRVINRFDWPDATPDQQQITDMLVLVPSTGAATPALPEQDDVVELQEPESLI